MIRQYLAYITNVTEDKTKFFYTINGDSPKEVIVRVYNQYLEYLEYENKITIHPGAIYWTMIPSYCSNRYVEFRDASNFEIVGLFSLSGLYDFKDCDYNSYIKNILPSLNDTNKKDIHYVLNEIFYLKTYNNDFVSVEAGDVVFDIGFNYGLFTIDALKRNPSKVIAFEPNPTLVNLWNNNNNISNVQLNKFAVGANSGVAKFYENDFAAKSSMYDNINVAEMNNSYDVNVIGFNEYILNNGIDKIDYLKVDCEGAEYEIFESIDMDFLTNKVNKIALEFHHNIHNEKVIRLISKLKECNFEIRKVYNDGDSTGMLYAHK
jgi:FkbM family methyltransferase